MMRATVSVVCLCALSAYRPPADTPHPGRLRWTSRTPKDAALERLSFPRHRLVYGSNSTSRASRQASISLYIPPNRKVRSARFQVRGPPFGGAHVEHGGGLLAGDIPDFSLMVAADGTASVPVVAPNVTLGADDHSVCTNGDTAIVTHAVASSASTAEPTRVACGVITKPE